MSQALRKLVGAIRRSNTAVIFTNQLRMKIGVLFGNPETTSGGRALKFYAAVRLDIRRMEAIKAGGEVIGNRTRVRVKKNKVAPPFRTAEFDIMYNEGISKAGDVLDMAVEVGVVEKRGAYYSYNEDRIGHGRENTKDFLRQNPEIIEEVVLKIREQMNAPSMPSASDTEEEDTNPEDES
jgi:recombination protein RecA